MTTELQDIIATLNRLDAVQSKTPPPLVSQARQQRDYPIRPKLGQIGAAPKRDHKHHNVAPPPAWDWRSKGG